MISVTSLAAGNVGTGTPASCTEASLDTALAGGGNVQFNCGPTAVTIVTTGTKTISATTTMFMFAGGAGSVTLDGVTNVFPIISVNAPGFASFASTDVSFANGSVGIQVFNNGASFRSGSIIGNTDGVIIYSSGSFSANNCSIESSTRIGIQAWFSVTGEIYLDECTVANNGASGIQIDGAATANVRRSTFNGNSNGIYLNGNGAVLNLSNSTIYDNTTGLYMGSGDTATAHISNSTFKKDGSSSIWNNSGTVNYKNTILYGSTNQTCRGPGSFVSAGGNFAQDSSCTGATINAQVGSLLGTLADNGGATKTVALTSLNPAIDAVTDCTIISTATYLTGGAVSGDQRRISRPQGGSCDAGAFERIPVMYTLNFVGSGTGWAVLSELPAFRINCILLPLSSPPTSGDCTETLEEGSSLTVQVSSYNGTTELAGFIGCDSSPHPGSCTQTLDSGNETVTVKLKARTTTTLVANSGTPSCSEDSYSVSVAVSSQEVAFGTPTGTVVVDDGDGNTCNATLSGGTGSCTLANSPDTRTLTLTATYNGTTNYSISSKTVSHLSDCSTCNENMVSGLTELVDIEHEACEVLVLGPDFVVADGVSVSAKSGEEIWFAPGFSMGAGATLDANVCGQSLCEASATGSPMPASCHSCVVDICTASPECCNSEWTAACVAQVGTECDLICE